MIIRIRAAMYCARENQDKKMDSAEAKVRRARMFHVKHSIEVLGK